MEPYPRQTGAALALWPKSPESLERDGKTLGEGARWGATIRKASAEVSGEYPEGRETVGDEGDSQS